jgi:RimJ/RimL family protein N-acetyltransferase
MNVVLRPARPDDAKEMTRWFADLASLAEWGGPMVRFPLTAEDLAEWIGEAADEQPRICFTAADEQDRPIGHVQFLRDPPRRWARLGRFGVAPARRGQGFGRALFEEALRMAFVDLGIERLALFVVPGNSRAIGLYRSCGFRDDGPAEGSWLVGGKPYAMNRMSLTKPDWLRPIEAAPVAAKVS